MTVSIAPNSTRAPSLVAALTDEGFRLFFPLAALYAACSPLLWVFVLNPDVSATSRIPSSLWHAHEMLIGALGAALIGFITTAVPEWTDTDRLKGRALLALAASWSVARLASLASHDLLVPLAAIADALWLGALVVYLAAVSWRRRTTRLLAFVCWVGALLVAALVTKWSFLTGDIDLARTMLRVVALIFLGLLGLALARITVAVTNLVLDPSEATSPFRPHPGRLNLSTGIVAVVIVGEIAGLSPAASAYLWIAAGAAFLDRVAEAFVGSEVGRAEILALAGSSALSGAGLLTIGIARLGGPISETAALHLATMGGLGLGILAVFAIAGRLHTGHALGLDRVTRVAFVLLVLAALMRAFPEVAPPWLAIGPVHGIATFAWSAAFLLWLNAYWPMLSDPSTLGARRC